MGSSRVRQASAWRLCDDDVLSRFCQDRILGAQAGKIWALRVSRTRQGAAERDCEAEGQGSATAGSGSFGWRGMAATGPLCGSDDNGTCTGSRRGAALGAGASARDRGSGDRAEFAIIP